MLLRTQGQRGHPWTGRGQYRDTRGPPSPMSCQRPALIRECSADGWSPGHTKRHLVDLSLVFETIGIFKLPQTGLRKHPVVCCRPLSLSSGFLPELLLKTGALFDVFHI